MVSRIIKVKLSLKPCRASSLPLSRPILIGCKKLHERCSGLVDWLILADAKC